MDSEEKEVAAHRRDRSYQGPNGNNIMVTPCKTGRRAHELAVETPSRFIRSRDEYGGEGKEITCSREHASTDGLLEHRVKVCPAPLVRPVEGGINGTRSPLQNDLDPGPSEEGEDEGEGGSKRRSYPRTLKTPCSWGCRQICLKWLYRPSWRSSKTPKMRKLGSNRKKDSAKRTLRRGRSLHHRNPNYKHPIHPLPQ